MSGVRVALAETFVTSVSFGEDAIELQYMHQRDQGRKVSFARVCMLNLSDEPDKFHDLQEYLCDLIQYAEEEHRETVISGRASVRERMLRANEEQEREEAQSDATET